MGLLAVIAVQLAVCIVEVTLATILAKIMWDKLAECTATTIDQFFTWKQTFFGPNPTFLPLPPCNVVRKERLADESSNIASGGGRGERATIAAIRKKALCPTHFGQDCRYMILLGLIFLAGANVGLTPAEPHGNSTTSFLRQTLRDQSRTLGTSTRPQNLSLTQPNSYHKPKPGEGRHACPQKPGLIPNMIRKRVHPPVPKT